MVKINTTRTNEVLIVSAYYDTHAVSMKKQLDSDDVTLYIYKRNIKGGYDLALTIEPELVNRYGVTPKTILAMVGDSGVKSARTVNLLIAKITGALSNIGNVAYFDWDTYPSEKAKSGSKRGRRRKTRKN